MIRRIVLAALVAPAALTLSGCHMLMGERVEVPPAHVGKVMTKDGYKETTYTPSRFRLDRCVMYCDKLVLVDVGDHSFRERMELFMPKDKLTMSFDLRLTMAVNPDQYDAILERVMPEVDVNKDARVIAVGKIYSIYAQQIVLAEAREFLSQYSIDEVAGSREAINAQLSKRLSESIGSRTPFLVRYAGMADITYPEVIVKAQVNSAERREMIRQEEAQLEVSKVQLERQLQEQKMQRAIDVERAQTEAQVNKILGDSVTPEYVRYRSLDAMDKMAASDNKVFVPSSMLDSIAGQVTLGNAAR